MYGFPLEMPPVMRWSKVALSAFAVLRVFA